MPVQTASTNAIAARSAFVTVLAWVFIVVAGLATLVSLLQVFIVFTMTPADPIAGSSAAEADALPAFARFLVGHLRFFFLAFLAVAVATLCAAVGLLQRKNWARLALVAILAFGIAWNVAALVLQQSMLSSMAMAPAGVPTDVRLEWERTTSVVSAFSIAVTVGLSALFAWIIRRLLSAPVRAEFLPGR